MSFNELKGNGITASIRDVEIKNRRAQYTYLSKIATTCTTDTAILYRDYECALPLIDLLERQQLEYRLKNINTDFFEDKVVTDIIDIINFAYNPQDIELFMKIYHKIALAIDKQAAVEACRNSKEKNLPIIDAAIEYGNLSQKSLLRANTIQKHLKELLDDPADRAVYRIAKYMGYSVYMAKMGMRDEDIQILDALGLNEETPLRLIERISELKEIIKNKQDNPQCPLVLSTIDDSRDITYDTVYLMDAKDGILPRNVIKDMDDASDKEIKEYDIERSVYETAITRAKGNLIIFSFKHESVFSYELLGKSDKPIAKSHARKNLLLSKSAQSQLLEKKTVVESEYRNKVEEIRNSGHIKHKTYGDGKVIAFNGDTLEIAFPNKTAKCKLKFMMENGLIV